MYSTVSRLVIDCNRKKSAPDLVPAKTERGFVAANTDLDEAEIIYRYDEFHAPFHNLVGSVLQDRGKECVVVSIHSYTQEFNGETRDFEVGILHDTDRRLGAVLLEELTSLAEYDVRENEPYSAADGVYYTLDRHAQTQGRPCVMIEIRNDQVDTEAQQKNWANLLSTSLTTAQNIISQNTSLQRSPSL